MSEDVPVEMSACGEDKHCTTSTFINGDVLFLLQHILVIATYDSGEVILYHYWRVGSGAVLMPVILSHKRTWLTYF